MRHINMITYNDAPEPWGLFFQDNATPQMEGLEELHNNIMFYLAIISFTISWIVISKIINYYFNIGKNDNKTQFDLVEMIAFTLMGFILVMAIKICMDSFYVNSVTHNDAGFSLSKLLKSEAVERFKLSGHPSTLDPGIHDVTGGMIMIDSHPKSGICRLGGIFPNNWTGPFYPLNLGCILFELKTSGLTVLSTNGIGDPALYNHLHQCTIDSGGRVRADGCIDLTYRLIDYIGNMR